jgi:hypothetical protein
MSVFEIILAAILAPGASSVAREAAAAAGDAPYCIQIADGSGAYRPAEALRDLSVFAMRAQSSGPIKLQFHGVLAVGDGANPRVFNWSYRRGAFQEIGSTQALRPHGVPAVSCAPRHDFAAHLPLLASTAAQESPKRLRVAGRDFTMPAGYAFKVVNELNNPVLFLKAEAPRFLPSPASAERHAFGVQIYLQPESVASWLEPRPNYLAEDRGEGPFGLRRRAVWWTGRASPRDERIELYARDANGRVTTVLECAPPPYGAARLCPHVFARDGLLYRFSLNVADLGQWRAVEDRLSGMVRSFQPPLPEP